MNTERSILIAFMGNYLINTVAASFVALIPASTGGGRLTPQYITFLVLAVILVGVLTWWHMRKASKGWKTGIVFGIVGFLTAIIVAFITGVSGVLGQTGSFAQVWSVLPNFWPFLWNVSTLVLLCYWVVPAALVGWWLGRGMMKPMATPSSMPQRPM